MGIVSMDVSGPLTILETSWGMGRLLEQNVDAIMKIIAMVIMPAKNKAAIVLLLVLLFVGQEREGEGVEDCCCCCCCCCCCAWTDVDDDDWSGRQTSDCVF